MKSNQPIIYRGEVYYADLSPVVGSEQGGIRPVLIVQNDIGNRHAPTTIVIPITGKLTKKPLPTHCPLAKDETGLSRESVALAEQVRIIDKSRLSTRMGRVGSATMDSIDKALKISLGLI